jgi:hypothetical protein
MATSITWPATLIPAEVGLNTSPNNTTGGQSFLGYEQVVGNSPGRWRATFGKIDIRTAAQVQAWNALAAKLCGRLIPLLIPLYDKQRAPSPAVTAATDAAVPSGAINFTINKTVGGELFEGMHFADSLHERLYRIAKIVTHVGGVYNVNIWPPVREAMAASASLEFNAPVFRVKLASDTEMDMDLELLKYGSPSVRFAEDVGS